MAAIVRSFAARAPACATSALPILSARSARALPVVCHRLFSTPAPAAEKPQRALVLNAGSSSIKYSVIDLNAAVAGGDGSLCSGLVEKIGLEGGLITHKTEDGGKKKLEGDIPDYPTALAQVVDLLTAAGGPIKHVEEINVVGHRVVHGGATLTAPTVIDSAVEAEIERCVPLAPLHNPANLNGIRVAKGIFPVPHVAIFDTAFHADMPPESYTYALPRSLLEEHGVRRYGFHGTSYTYVLGKAAELLGRPKESMNAIICHLGNGASMAAIKKGKCVDTTMGLTPLEGLVMGTRAGDVDAGVLAFMASHLKYTPDQIDKVLNKQSGLLGLSGTSDFRSVMEACEAGDEHAILARKVFTERIRKYVGAYMVKLGGEVDAFVFTGGIGENSAALRADVCEGLANFGVAIDASKNDLALPEVQASFARVKTMVIPTNEELSIALQSAQVSGLIPRTQATSRAQAAAPKAPAAAVSRGGTPLVRAAPNLREAVVPKAPRSPASKLEVALESAAAAAQAQMAHSPDVEALGHALLVEADSPSPTRLVEAALMSSVLPRVSKVGYFRLLSYGEGRDQKLEFMRAIAKFGLEDIPFDAQCGMTVDEAMHLFAASGGKTDEIFDTIIDKFTAYAADKDFVMVSGERITARGSSAAEMPGSTSFYARLASALNLPTLVVHNMSGHAVQGSDSPLRDGDGAPAVDTNSVKASLTGYKTGYDAANVRLAGAIVEGVPVASYERAAAAIRADLADSGIFPVAVLPRESKMTELTMAEVASALDTRVLYGAHNLETQVVRNVEVGTKQMPELISLLETKPGTLLVTSATRSEVLLSMLLVTQSKNVPLHPGILLTGCKEMPASVTRMLSGIETIGKPVLMTDKSTYEAAIALAHLRDAGPGRPSGHLRTSSIKLEAAEHLMELHLDKKFGAAMVRDNPTEDVSPIIFKHNMFAAARLNKQHIVLPEGDDVRVLTATGELLHRGLCDVTLLGPEEQIRTLAEKAHVNLDGVAIVDPHKVLLDEPQEWAEGLVQGLWKAREEKGMTESSARELLLHDEAYFGTMMMMNGLADGMVSGACHSTANTMRPALQLIKMAPGFSMASSVFFMLLRDKVFVYGDCAINVDPTAEELAQIALASARTSRAFGISPRIAMLSYATGDSNQGPMIDKVREATEIARERAPDELIEGPIQFDAAVDPAVAAVKFKGQDSPVAGKATVCIFPDLNAGNNAYKAVQQASKSSAVGPIMQGLRLPVNDLSRGCTVDDIVNTVVCTALQSIAVKEQTSREND